MLRRALELIPSSMPRLWRVAVELEDVEDMGYIWGGPSNMCASLRGHVAGIARLETYENARRVLNQASHPHLAARRWRRSRRSG